MNRNVCKYLNLSHVYVYRLKVFLDCFSELYALVAWFFHEPHYYAPNISRFDLNWKQRVKILSCRLWFNVKRNVFECTKMDGGRGKGVIDTPSYASEFLINGFDSVCHIHYVFEANRTY